MTKGGQRHLTDHPELYYYFGQYKIYVFIAETHDEIVIVLIVREISAWSPKPSRLYSHSHFPQLTIKISKYSLTEIIIS